MSYPNLLEYHLLSSCPLMDSSPSVCLFQSRFSCAPRYRDYSQKLLQRCADYLIHRCLSVTALFIEFSLPLCLSIFPSKVSVYFARSFHDVRRCFNLKTKVLYHEIASRSLSSPSMNRGAFSLTNGKNHPKFEQNALLGYPPTGFRAGSFISNRYEHHASQVDCLKPISDAFEDYFLDPEDFDYPITAYGDGSAETGFRSNSLVLYAGCGSEEHGS